MRFQDWIRKNLNQTIWITSALWLTTAILLIHSLIGEDLRLWNIKSNAWIEQALHHVERRTIRDLEIFSSSFLITYPQSRLTISLAENTIWNYPHSDSANSDLNDDWHETIAQERSKYRVKVATSWFSLFKDSMQAFLILLTSSLLWFLLTLYFVNYSSGLALRELDSLHREDRESSVIEFSELKKRLTRIESEKAYLSAEAAFGHLQARISHDLRAPLGTLSILSSSLAENAEARTLLIQCIERMRFVVNDSLDQRKILHAQRSVDLIESHLLAEASRQEKVVALKIDLSSLPVVSPTEREDFFRHILNLSLNSIDAISTRGAITIESRLLDRSTKRCEVSITDSGSGFSKEILETFHSGERIRSTKTQGNGLGLLACREWVLSRRGEISLKNENPGSRITIRI